MSYATVTLTGSYKNIVGTAEGGMVRIVPSTGPIIDAGGNVILSGALTVELVNGAFSVMLPATDDPNLNPTGFGYTVTANLYDSTVGPVSFSLPTSPSTVDMADITPVNASAFTPAATYLQRANNLSDLGSATAARTNLGLGSAATQASSAFDAAGAATTASAYRLGSGLGNAFAGVLATLRRGQRSTCIALIGDSTGDNKQPGTGTSVPEWGRVFTQRLAQDFPGYTLMERQWNDTNQSYDQPLAATQTGTINGGAERCVIFNKNTPGSLQFTGNAITGDIDIRVRIAPTTWTPTGDQTIAAKWESTGNQRSWLLLLKTTGALGFNWSTAGTAGAGEKDSTATIPSIASPPANGAPYWVRVTLTVNNGAAGSDVKFYTSPDGLTWTQLGSTVTTAGTTSIFGGTGPYQLGSFTSGLSSPFDGKVHRIEVHNGIVAAGVNGGSVVPYLPDDWDWESAETTVSFGGAPVLMFLNGSQSGQNVAYFDNATRRAIVHQPHGQAVLLISTAHNDGTQSRAIWLGAYNTMVTNIKALIPYVPIVAVGQNPTGLGGTFNITAQGIELRAARSALLQQWAASQAGVWSFDAWPWLTASDTVDQLHPTTGPGSGSEKWGLALYSRAFPGGATTY